MEKITDVHRTLAVSADYDVWVMVENWLFDCKTRGLSTGTIEFYQLKIKQFLDFLENQVINSVDLLTPDVIRRYLLHLEETGHNPGGRHAAYRTIRSFLSWWEAEIEPAGWRNPLKRVKPPKLPTEPIEGVKTAVILAMVDICPNNYTGLRDQALILSLADTGGRAAEILALNIDDLDLNAGSMLIRQGKGRKPRVVYVGTRTRRALRKYLNKRTDQSSALWTTVFGEQLAYSGLRGILTRRAHAAGVEVPTAHDFRRYFALSMLRAGEDIFSIQRLMGHADIGILRRYLAQTDQDAAEAHRRAAPVDRM